MDYSFRNTTKVSDTCFCENRGYPFYINKGDELFDTLAAEFSFLEVGKTAVHGSNGTEWETVDGCPVVEAQQRNLLAAFTNGIQLALDTFARTKGYDDIKSACSYAQSTDATFAKEAAYCVALRDTTWRKGYEIIADVQSGKRSTPTMAELLELLPVGSAAWPA